MKSFEYTITDPVGIHARPAGVLVKEIKKYTSTVTVIKGEKSVNALKLMALMGMGIKQGDTVKVTFADATQSGNLHLRRLTHSANLAIAAFVNGDQQLCLAGIFP